MLADGASGFTSDTPNIFNFLVSDFDRDLLAEAMENARKTDPETVDLSFCFLDKTVLCRCQVYAGEHGFFITGWEQPENILSFNSRQRL